MRSWHPEPGEATTWMSDFDILPPGAWGIDQIMSHYRAIFEHDPEYAPERIEQLMSIVPRPTLVCVGRSGSLGYCGFRIPGYSPVILESPIRGNATYVLFEDWEELARKSKGELRDKYKESFTKIVHSEDWRRWLHRVKKAVQG